MSLLEACVAGARTTVQDLGFSGARGQGVPWGGVMDRMALRLLNALLGNPPGSEALEVALTAPVLRVEGGAVRIALGGTLSGTVRGPGGGARALPAWVATTLAAGEELHLSPPDRGGTGLIGIAGGLDLPQVLGSRSTCLPAGFGGLSGRALRAGDRLRLRGEPADPGLPDLCVTRPPAPATGPIRVVPGPQTEWFAPGDLARFLSAAYVVTPRFDRMGLRLSGPTLGFAPGRGPDIVSDGITPGAIQVPGNGLPIILLADAQTTGGYAKIATVASADLPRLSACVAGDEIRFAAVTVAEAEAAARDASDALRRAVASIRPRPGPAALLGANLIGGVVDMRRPDHFAGHLFAQDGGA